MKKNNLNFTYYFLLVIISLVSCSDNIETNKILLEANDLTLKAVNFKELPEYIKNLSVSGNEKLKKASATKKGKSQFVNIGELAAIDKLYNWIRMGYGRFLL